MGDGDGFSCIPLALKINTNGRVQVSVVSTQVKKKTGACHHGAPKSRRVSSMEIDSPQTEFLCVFKNKVTTNSFWKQEAGASKGVALQAYWNWMPRRRNCVVFSCEFVFVYSHKREQKYRPNFTKSARHLSLGPEPAPLEADTTRKREI